MAEEDKVKKAAESSKKLTEELGNILDAVTSIGDKLVSSFENAVST